MHPAQRGIKWDQDVRLDKKAILKDSASSKCSHSMICKTSQGPLGIPLNGNQHPREPVLILQVIGEAHIRLYLLKA